MGAGPDFLGRLFDEHAPPPALYARRWCETPEAAAKLKQTTLAGFRDPSAPMIASRIKTRE